MNVPKLRFPEFEGEWEEMKFSNFLKPNFRDVPKPIQKYLAIGIRSHGKGTFQKPESEPDKIAMDTLYVVRENDLIVNITFAWEGAIAIVPKEDDGGHVSHRFPTYEFRKELVSHEYFRSVIADRRFRQKLELISPGGAGRNRVMSKPEFLKLKHRFPSLPEQKKIAAFLGVVDAKIAALRARRAGLERYKRGLMQALFSQTLRFTKPDGTAFPDWEEKRLGEVFTRVTRKNVEDNQNVLTISAQQGLVNQRDFFNKSVSAQDVTGYYLLKKGDFAYNKSYSKGYPMGAIKRLNNYEKGVVSTLYICFSADSETVSKYFEQYFDFGGLNREIHKIAQEGARNHGLLNMSVVEFFKDMIMPFPHPDEQAKIAEALSAMDAKIAAVGDQVAQMEAFKKGLLQQMFV
ncbi:restriction endonuclease subunit S [Pseudophaeobacter arcticus]|uniref:restriction endonuclease subunit S n=1 Tax=Pseudophaeobacter arcticus TaxID=385492 RepID=UPI003A97B359